VSDGGLADPASRLVAVYGVKSQAISGVDTRMHC